MGLGHLPNPLMGASLQSGAPQSQGNFVHIWGKICMDIEDGRLAGHLPVVFSIEPECTGSGRSLLCYSGGRICRGSGAAAAAIAS